MDTKSKKIMVEGSLTSALPQHRFFLNEALQIEALKDESGSIEFSRTGNRIEFSRPVASFTFKYSGFLIRSGSRDFKSHPWIEPDQIRLTEITLWYPTFYYGTSSVPWPPEPAVGTLKIAAIPNIHFITSGTEKKRNEFEFIWPGDFVVVGTKAESRIYGTSPKLRVQSDRSDQIQKVIRKELDGLNSCLGKIGFSEVNVVEFPATGTKNGLAFLSSNLIVLSSETSNYVIKGTPRALRVVSHELSHLWFGGSLRATGPFSRWLTESFAEYYAWQNVRAQLGKSEFDRIISETKDATRTNVQKVTDGWENEQVYTIGTLAVLDLSSVVGEQNLDQTIRHIYSDRMRWSLDTLFGELAKLKDVDKTRLHDFRAKWGMN